MNDFAQLHTRNMDHKICFSTRFVKLKYIDYIMLEIVFIKFDGM